MRKVESREYKMMLEHRWFERRKKSTIDFWKEATNLVASQSISHEGEFDRQEKREITFFDTSDFLLRRNRLVFRRRVEENGGLQFTIKARDEDRYIADSFDLDQVDGLRNNRKFEEDIATPFRSRFSHSNTVSFKRESDSPFGKEPTKLKDVAAIFPLLGKLRRGDESVSKNTKLMPVNGIKACERVYKGPEFTLTDSHSATVALILWSNAWDGRPLVAEFSFRCKDKDEEYSAEMAWAARRCFETLQVFDWHRPESMTKTQYVYRDRIA